MEALSLLLLTSAPPTPRVSEDGKTVTRVEDFRPQGKEQVEARTVYVENLPQEADHDSLTKVTLQGEHIRGVNYFGHSSQIWMISGLHYVAP